MPAHVHAMARNVSSVPVPLTIVAVSSALSPVTVSFAPAAVTCAKVARAGLPAGEHPRHEVTAVSYTHLTLPTKRIV